MKGRSIGNAGRDRSSLYNAFPAGASEIPLARAVMLDEMSASFSVIAHASPSWPGLTRRDRAPSPSWPGPPRQAEPSPVGPSPSWPGSTRPSTRTRRRRYGAALRASSSIACGRVDARLEGGHDGWGAVERKALSRGRHGPPRHGRALPVMAGLDPAIHANATAKVRCGPLRPPSGTIRGRVDARLKGGHDGWIRACRRPPPLPRLASGEGQGGGRT